MHSQKRITFPSKLGGVSVGIAVLEEYGPRLLGHVVHSDSILRTLVQNACNVSFSLLYL